MGATACACPAPTTASPLGGKQGRAGRTRRAPVPLGIHELMLRSVTISLNWQIVELDGVVLENPPARELVQTFQCLARMLTVQRIQARLVREVGLKEYVLHPNDVSQPLKCHLLEPKRPVDVVTEQLGWPARELHLAGHCFVQ